MGALAARGLPAIRAAAAGAWVHGRAADVAGHDGLVAGDLIEALPVVLAALAAATGHVSDRNHPNHPDRPE